MRLIVKPAGVAILVSGIGVLSFLAFNNLRNSKDNSSGHLSASLLAPQPTDTVSAMLTVKSGGIVLRNELADARPARGSSVLFGGDFESEFGKYVLPPPDSNPETLPAIARVKGEIGSSWFDNSHWADIDLVYSKDTSDPHSGKACQKISIGKVGPQAALQFNQTCRLAKGKTYRLTGWLRASEPTPVEFGIRMMAGGRSYKNAQVDLTQEWKRVRMDISVDPAGELFLMLRCDKSNVDLYLDDIELVEV